MLPVMKAIERWRWRIHGIGGRVHTTRWHMIEADALELDPLAVREQWTREVLSVPTTEDEMDSRRPSSMLRPR
jgi:hypothetical protein